MVALTEHFEDCTNSTTAHEVYYNQSSPQRVRSPRIRSFDDFPVLEAWPETVPVQALPAPVLEGTARD